LTRSRSASSSRIPRSSFSRPAGFPARVGKTSRLGPLVRPNRAGFLEFLLHECRARVLHSKFSACCIFRRSRARRHERPPSRSWCWSRLPAFRRRPSPAFSAENLTRTARSKRPMSTAAQRTPLSCRAPATVPSNRRIPVRVAPPISCRPVPRRHCGRTSRTRTRVLAVRGLITCRPAGDTLFLCQFCTRPF